VFEKSGIMPTRTLIEKQPEIIVIEGEEEEPIVMSDTLSD